MLLREATENDGRSISYVTLGDYFEGFCSRRRCCHNCHDCGIRNLALYAAPPNAARSCIASLLYLRNFELINSQLSYDAAGPETSAFQHFWSLSVQGQFYLVIPLVVLVLVWIARKRNQPAVSGSQ